MATKQELSYDTKTIIVILTLLFVYPIGAWLMYRWMNWPKWIKFLILVPIIIVALAFISTVVLGFITAFAPALSR